MTSTTLMSISAPLHRIPIDIGETDRVIEKASDVTVVSTYSNQSKLCNKPPSDTTYHLGEFSKQADSASKLEIRDYHALYLIPSSVEIPEWDHSIYGRLLENQFRLVLLKAGTDSTPVEVTFLVGDLKLPPEYVALSYTVEANVSTSRIQVRHGNVLYEVDIDKDLLAALRQLRHSRLDIPIWVDALSINPHDKEEMTQQIRNRSEIFRQAQNVCVWLGEGDEEMMKALLFAKSLLDFDIFEEAIGEGAQADFVRLVHFMNRPWFRMRWCVQDVLLGTSVTIHYGTHVISWPDLVDTVTLVDSRWQTIQNGFDSKQKQAIGHFHFVGAAALIKCSHNLIQNLHKGQSSRHGLSIEMILSLLPTFEVAIPHDAVFAILGVASDAHLTDQIKIDYSTQPIELLDRVTRLIIRSSESLNIICRPWAPQIELPSWITTVDKLPYQRRRSGHQYDQRYGTSLVGLPKACWYNANGRLSLTSANLLTLDGFSGPPSQLVVTGFCVGTVNQLGGESINGSIPARWLLISGWDDIAQRPVPDHFWSTLVAGRDGHGNTPPRWFRRMCQYSFRRSISDQIDTSSLKDSSNSQNEIEFLNRVRDVTWSRTLATVSMESQFSGLVLSDPVTVLGPADMQKGDQICVLFGCDVPVVLRQDHKHHVLIGECYVHGIMDGELADPDIDAEDFILI